MSLVGPERWCDGKVKGKAGPAAQLEKAARFDS